MNPRTIAAILVIGALGAFAFIIMAMIGIQKVAEKPLVRVRIELADVHKVKEVSLAVVPPTGGPRTLQVGYETSIIHSSLDAQREEMEAIAQFAVEKVRVAEKEEDLTLKREGMPVPDRGPINLVSVRRTWRSQRACFSRSDEVMHEWTPPPPPPSPPGRR